MRVSISLECLQSCLVLEILVFEHMDEPKTDNTHANRIRLLKRAGLLPHEIDNTLYVLRKTAIPQYMREQIL